MLVKAIRKYFILLHNTFYCPMNLHAKFEGNIKTGFRDIGFLHTTLFAQFHDKSCCYDNKMGVVFKFMLDIC